MNILGSVCMAGGLVSGYVGLCMYVGCDGDGDGDDGGGAEIDLGRMVKGEGCVCA